MNTVSENLTADWRAIFEGLRPAIVYLAEREPTTTIPEGVRAFFALHGLIMDVSTASTLLLYCEERGDIDITGDYFRLGPLHPVES